MKWERTDGLRLNVARASALVLLALSSASQSCGRKHVEEEHSANSLQVGMTGFFWGVRGKSSEYIVGDEKGGRMEGENLTEKAFGRTLESRIYRIGQVLSLHDTR